MSNPESRFGMVFKTFEHYTPAERAECMYLLESRWCWDCGKTYDECACGLHVSGGAAKKLGLTDDLH